MVAHSLNQSHQLLAQPVKRGRAAMPKRKAAQPASGEGRSARAPSKRIAKARKSKANQDAAATRSAKSPDVIDLVEPPSNGEDSDAESSGNVNHQTSVGAIANVA